MENKNWGAVNGHDVNLYQLSNANNIRVSITNFGATIQSIIVPDKNGKFEDIALGYDDLQGYIGDPFYMGAIVGRFANRIAGGLVKLDGQHYQLTVKEGGFHHHGGKVGFNKKVWSTKSANKQELKLEYLSPDGEEGFPGNLLVTVTYTLNDQNQLIVDYIAETDKTTLINLTQHAYFNLAGHNRGDITDHELMMPLSTYLPVNTMHVPIGHATPVEGTPFDFRRATTIGKRIDADDPQLKQGHGYDNTWVVKENRSPELKLVARITESASGRVMTVYTTEPSIHIYTGNFLDGSAGKGGANYIKRGGLCLETQGYPDAPNHPHFPSAVLRPGEIFSSKTIFEFSISK